MVKNRRSKLFGSLPAQIIFGERGGPVHINRQAASEGEREKRTYMYRLAERERERNGHTCTDWQRERERDRETDRQTDRQNDRHVCKQRTQTFGGMMIETDFLSV